MPSHCFPTADLSVVFFRRAAAHVVAAVPLKPAAWIVGVNPSVLAPGGQRLARVDAEVIERTVAAGSSELRAHNQLLGNSARASVMYVPPNTPSRSICLG